MLNLMFSTIGYTLTAIGFLFLFGLLLTTRQSTLQRTILLFSSLVSALWAADAALSFSYPIWGLAVLPLETLRNIGWFLLIMASITDKPTFNAFLVMDSIPKYSLPLLAACLLAELTNDWSQWLPYRDVLALHLAQSAVGLWLIEQLYRRTAREDRWMIKPLTLGLGLTFAYDFALYANGVLTSILDLLFFSARGWVMLVAIPLITMTARRIKNWSTRIYVSRSVVYSSTLLTIAGLYLLVMALAGYYIRYLGKSWGNLAQDIFFALSSLILASLFMSESLRRQLKVFITKHFYANKYEYREEWMKFADVLEQNAENPNHIALNAIIQPFDCERGMLATLADGTLKNKACYNLNDGYTESDDHLTALAQAAVQHHWIIDIEHLQTHTDTVPFDYDQAVIDSMTTFSYIIPITSQNGDNSACFISRPHSTQALNWEDRDLMFAISKQLSVYLNLCRTNQVLAENQQFDTFNRMSAFLAHDLKNILAQLQLLSKNAQKHKHNPEFIDDAFDTIDCATARLSKVVNHLRKKNLADSPKQTFSVDALIRQSCQERAVNQPVPVYTTKDTPAMTLNADKERFHSMMIHLIQNAQEATSPDGFVHISTAQQAQDFTIQVEDNGSGMTESFIEHHLFKPFDTTKGNSGMGIGVYDAKRFIEQLHGYIQVQSAPGKGACFTIHIPLTECVVNDF